MPARVRSESKSADLPVCAAAAAAAARAGRGAQASQSTVREREHSACGQSVVGLFCNPPKEGMTANILAGGSPASTEIQNSILWILFIFSVFLPPLRDCTDCPHRSHAPSGESRESDSCTRTFPYPVTGGLRNPHHHPHGTPCLASILLYGEGFSLLSEL